MSVKHSGSTASKYLNLFKLHGIQEPKPPTANIGRIIRVNHAGEIGADLIYKGQLAVLGNTSIGPKLKQMWEEEKVHRAKFEELINQLRIRPSILHPVWIAAGYCVGVGTALLGPHAAMACTVGVETVIVQHYNEQLRELMTDADNHKELLDTIKRFRDEEQDHHDTGIEEGAEQAPFYNIFNQAIQLGSKWCVVVAKLA